MLRTYFQLTEYFTILEKNCVFSNLEKQDYRRGLKYINMKKSTFLFLYLLPLALSAQIKVIDNPDYRFKNTGLETISRIELHDTITKVHVHVTFIPGWWVEYDAFSYLQPVGSKKRYHLIGIENAEMDKKLSTSTGLADYVLLFHPMDKSVKEFHYGNVNNNKEEISIFNVSLEQSFDSTRYEKSRETPAHIVKRLQDEIKKTEGEKTADFDSDIFFDNSPSRLVGFIKGYMSDTVQTRPIQSCKLNGDIQSFPLKIYPNGYFEADIKMEYPKMLAFSLLKAGEATFYIEPGQTLAMILDWEDFLDASRYRDRRYILTKTEFAGALADVNHDLLKRTIFKPHGYEIDRRMKNMSPAEHRQDLEARINNHLDSIWKTDAKHPIHPKARRLIENEIKADALSELLQFSISYLRREENTVTPLSADYYSLLGVIPANDRSLLSVLSADKMISSLNYASIFLHPDNMYRPEFNPDQSFGDYLVAEGKVLSDETIKLLPLIEKTVRPGGSKLNEEEKKATTENKDVIRRILQGYIRELIAYQKKYTKRDLWEDFKVSMQKRDDIFTDSMNISGILKDVSMYRYFYGWLRAKSNLTPNDVNSMTEKFSDRITNPFLKSLLDEPGDEYKNETYRFSATIPRNWRIYGQVIDDTVNQRAIADWALPRTYSELEKADIGNSVSITAYKRDDINSVEKLIQFQHAKYKENNPTDEIALEEDKKNSNARIINITKSNGVKHRGKWHLVYQNNIAYIVAFMATPGTYEKNLPLFEDFYKNVDFY